jgi:apolipoprotein N-acyltransferase
MAEQRSNRATNSGRWSYLWLAIGAILLVFANGRWVIPPATWLSLVFVIRFMRTQKSARGLILVALTCIAVNIITWRGMILMPGKLYYIITAGIGLIYFLPFLADRLIAPRVGGFVSTLVFPLAWTTMEHLNSLANPFGSWGSLAYTQFGYLPMMQVVSVTGLSGLAFLIAWFASVVNWVWEKDFRWSKVRLGIGLYAGIMTLIMLLGGARLALFPPASDTVRVGSITLPQTLVSQFRECVRAADWKCVGQTSGEILDDLIERSRQAARAGAKIVFWQEYAGRVLLDDEAALDEAAMIERGRELARQENIYLGMALLAITRSFPKELAENKVIWIAPSGDVMGEYLKSRPFVGEPVIAGEGKVALLDTPYGKIASVICFDMDFPGLIRQAGQAGADLMLVPTNDWNEAKLMHRNMAFFRAIENGFSLVRSNSGQGLSAAADYQGRILANTDHYTTEERLMIADVPTQGVITIYSRIGDLFAWLCVAGFVAVAGWVVIRRRAT